MDRQAMSEVSGIGGTHPTPPVARSAPAAHELRTPAEHHAPQDAVELSDVGTMMARLRELPEIRQEKVARIRAEIEAGTYETPERLEATIDRLLEELA